MSEAIKTERGTVHFITNHKPRAVVSYFDLPEAEQADFDYVNPDEYPEPRFFNYLGSWYDVQEFSTMGEMSLDELRALGFDGIQPDSYFSATIVKWFDSDGVYTPSEGEIVVGRIHW